MIACTGRVTFSDTDRFSQQEYCLLPVCGCAHGACAEACNLFFLPSQTLSPLQRRLSTNRPQLCKVRLAFLDDLHFDIRRNRTTVCGEEGVEV